MIQLASWINNENLLSVNRSIKSEISNHFKPMQYLPYCSAGPISISNYLKNKKKTGKRLCSATIHMYRYKHLKILICFQDLSLSLSHPPPPASFPSLSHRLPPSLFPPFYLSLSFPLSLFPPFFLSTFSLFPSLFCPLPPLSLSLSTRVKVFNGACATCIKVSGYNPLIPLTECNQYIMTPWLAPGAVPFEDVKNIITFQLSNYLLTNDFNFIIDFLLFMN